MSKDIPKASRSEQIAVCISREIQDHDVIGLGFGTILPAAGALLAQRLHAPRSILFYSPAGVYVRTLPRLTLSLAEWIAEGQVIARPNLPQLFTTELHPAHLEFFRPAQIDRRGNFNTTVIGPLATPLLRLPGGAGIPDVTDRFSRLYFYVPRHDSRCFVDHVDFVTGAGHDNRTTPQESGPYRMITDLGVFGYGPSGEMAVISLHEGVDISDVMASTGFPLAGLPGVHEIATTQPPTGEELDLLRMEIDPLGIVDLESLGSRERRSRIAEIYEQEGEWYAKCR